MRNIVESPTGIGDLPARRWLFVEFLGEGAASVTYKVLPIDGPSDQAFVLKLRNDLPMFEMETLHHSLEINGTLYPNHPLLMTAEARLLKLTDEILAELDNTHMLFRVELYLELLRGIVILLVAICGESSNHQEQLTAALRSAPICAWLDDNFLHCIDDALEDDLTNSQHRPFLEAIRLEVSQQIHEPASDRLPLSHNPLFNLLGLHAQDYVNREEMCRIADSPQFRARLKSEHAPGLLDLLSTIDIYLARGLSGRMGPMPTQVQSISDTASAACELLATIGSDQALVLAQNYELRIREASSDPRRAPNQGSPPAETHQATPATEGGGRAAPTSPPSSNRSSRESHRITRRLFTAADKVHLDELDLSPRVYPWVSAGHSIASFHSVGLLHGDITDQNILFQPLTGAAIMIDPSSALSREDFDS